MRVIQFEILFSCRERNKSYSTNSLTDRKATLGQRHDLVGKKIRVINHIEDDCRLVRALTESGQPLGLLHVSSPWNRLPHSLEVRTAVAAYVSAGKLKVAAGHDAVEIFMNFCEQQAEKKLPVHPAYLEARRILTEVAEATMSGHSMLEIPRERQTTRLIMRVIRPPHIDAKPPIATQEYAVYIVAFASNHLEKIAYG